MGKYEMLYAAYHNRPGVVVAIAPEHFDMFMEHFDCEMPYSLSESSAAYYIDTGLDLGRGIEKWDFYFWTPKGSIPAFVPVNIRTPLTLVPGTRRLDPQKARERVLSAPATTPPLSIRKAQNALQWARERAQAERSR
jgi:hypothetical protein